MDDLDSLRLALEAERHNHRKDNEILLTRQRTLFAVVRALLDFEYPKVGMEANHPSPKGALLWGRLRTLLDQYERESVR